jgi:hypothetical protein
MNGKAMMTDSQCSPPNQRISVELLLYIRYEPIEQNVKVSARNLLCRGLHFGIDDGIEAFRAHLSSTILGRQGRGCHIKFFFLSIVGMEHGEMRRKGGKNTTYPLIHGFWFGAGTVTGHAMDAIGIILLQV